MTSPLSHHAPVSVCSWQRLPSNSCTVLMCHHGNQSPLMCSLLASDDEDDDLHKGVCEQDH